MKKMIGYCKECGFLYAAGSECQCGNTSVIDFSVVEKAIEQANEELLYIDRCSSVGGAPCEGLYFDKDISEICCNVVGAPCHCAIGNKL